MYLIILFLLNTYFASSHLIYYKNTNDICNNYVTREYDKMSGDTYLRSKEPLFLTDNRSYSIDIMMLNPLQSTENIDLILIFKVNGAGNCISEENIINVLFEDGERMNIQNTSKMNCDNEFVIYFGSSYNNKDQLYKLRKKRISALRVWTTKGYIQSDLTKNNGITLTSTFDCILK